MVQIWFWSLDAQLWERHRCAFSCGPYPNDSVEFPPKNDGAQPILNATRFVASTRSDRQFGELNSDNVTSAHTVRAVPIDG